VTDYVTTHGVKTNTIPVALYEYDFVSPKWSPDTAGWSMLLSIILFMGLAASFTLDKLVSAKIKNNF
jgi:hypothetical protein